MLVRTARRSCSLPPCPRSTVCRDTDDTDDPYFRSVDPLLRLDRVICAMRSKQKRCGLRAEFHVRRLVFAHLANFVHPEGDRGRIASAGTKEEAPIEPLVLSGRRGERRRGAEIVLTGVNVFTGGKTTHDLVRTVT